MAKTIQAELTGLGSRPSTLDGLLLHPIRASEGAPGPVDESHPASPGGREPGSPGDSYPDWKLDHAGLAQFYLVGFNWLRAITQRREANYYHTFGAEAFDRARALGWPSELNADFRSPISYNQFRNALVLHKPMFFGHAAQVLLALELALADAIKASRYEGSTSDVYDHIRILPACYYVDGFDPGLLAHMRSAIADFDRELLAASGQTSPRLIEQLAYGKCVTRKTARAIRSRTLELAAIDRPPFIVGDVKAVPGARGLGRKSASDAEIIDFNNPDLYKDVSSKAPS